MQPRSATGRRDRQDGPAGAAASARETRTDLAGANAAGGYGLGGCYGIQVLVASRRKHWRDEVSAEIRRAGFSATTVDCAVDALTILALGLPMDVLVTDADLLGDLRCARLAVEARALRPNLGIVFANDRDEDDVAQCVPDARVIPRGAGDGRLAVTVREALQARV